MTCPVICLAGPTGAGKTALALFLAAELGGEIVNADSRQIYADLPVVTAQPDAAERAKVPHHLYGFLPCSAKISAGQWCGLAGEKCQAIAARGKIPIVVGGTGFYFEALLRGLAPMPEVPASLQRIMAERMAAEGADALYAELRQIDPVYAAKIHNHDRQRICRALEIHAASGKPFSWWHGQGRLAPVACGPLLVLNSSLAWLEPRLARRIELMLANGALKEAESARVKYRQGKVPAFNGIGARELMDFLAGRLDMEECRKAWLAATRAYAKRQLTWFRGRREAVWIDPEKPREALEIAREYLHRTHSTDYRQ